VVRLLALFAALFAAAVIALAAERTPRPAPADAPAQAFSAARALVDVRAMAAVPHPQGSPANAAVRDKLVARMTTLGLSPLVRTGAAIEVGADRAGLPRAQGGQTETVIGVLPGRDRAAPAVALMAHYDSAPGSPGAADDMAGVAGALEVVRAIAARGTPARDVMLVITDGEESGLLGARAFFTGDPLAKRIGFILNMEARGSGGRAQMFQTGSDSAGAIDLLKRTAVGPQASSLTTFVYRFMPVDTDFTLAQAAGIDGMNYAFIGREFDYHAATSTPAALDAGSLQDMGGQVLAAAAAVAASPTLPRRGPTPVYGQAPGGMTIVYPAFGGWLVLGACGLLLAIAVRRSREVEAFHWPDAARGAGAALTAVLGAAALMHFARRATGAGFGFIEHRFLLAQVGRWEIALMLLGGGFLIAAAAELARGRRAIAAVPLLAGLGSCALGGLDEVGLGLGVAGGLVALATYGRATSRTGAWTGVLGLGLVLGVLLQLFAPQTAFIIGWPLAIASLAAAVTAAGAHRGSGALAVLGLAAAVGLGWIGGIAHGMFLGLDVVEVLGLPVLLAALLIWPLAQPEEGAPPARLVGPVLLAAGLCVLAAVRFNDPYDARHPRFSVVGYQIDQDTRQAFRFSATATRSPWADAVLRRDGGSIAKTPHWSFGRPRDAAPAPFIQEAPPTFALVSNADGVLRLRATPPPGARILTLQLNPNTPVTLVSVGGAKAGIRLPPGRASRISWIAAPQGVDLLLRPGGPGAMRVDYVATLERWPVGAPPLSPRPAAVAPFDLSDSTFVTGARRFTW